MPERPKRRPSRRCIHHFRVYWVSHWRIAHQRGNRCAMLESSHQDRISLSDRFQKNEVFLFCPRQYMHISCHGPPQNNAIPHEYELAIFSPRWNAITEAIMFTAAKSPDMKPQRLELTRVISEIEKPQNGNRQVFIIGMRRASIWRGGEASPS